MRREIVAILLPFLPGFAPGRLPGRCAVRLILRRFATWQKFAME
jgi:hypothetical protein